MSNAKGPRAGRLHDKFSAGAQAKKVSEFAQAEKINMTVAHNGNDKAYSMMIQDVSILSGAGVKVKGIVKVEEENLPPRVMHLVVSKKGISFLEGVFTDDSGINNLEIVSLDRRSARVLVNRINNFIGREFMLPTDLPLA